MALKIYDQVRSGQVHYTRTDRDSASEWGFYLRRPHSDRCFWISFCYPFRSLSEKNQRYIRPDPPPKPQKHVEAPAVFEGPNSSKQDGVVCPVCTPMVKLDLNNFQVPCTHISDPSEKYMSLMIPAYNEEHRLPGALEETKNWVFNGVIIDDASVDGTKRVALDFVRKYTVDKVRPILLGRNHGKGKTIRKGMLHSLGEMLLMLDADGATKVNDLEKLENQIHAFARKECHDGDLAASNSSFRISDIPIAAFGSRAHLEEKTLATRKWYRNFLMMGFHLVVLLTAGPGIRDTQCGVKMFTRAAARKLFKKHPFK